MTPFSLWRLLNQRPFSDSGDQSDTAQRQQPAGTDIGQSLINLWNRAQQNRSASPSWNAGSADAAVHPFGAPGSLTFANPGSTGGPIPIGQPQSFASIDQPDYSSMAPPNAPDMGDVLNDRHSRCIDKCIHLLTSPSGDYQSSEFRKCYGQCMGRLP